MKKKLITYFDFVKKQDKEMLKRCGVKFDTDFQNMFDGKISVEKYVDIVFYPRVKK